MINTNRYKIMDKIITNGVEEVDPLSLEISFFQPRRKVLTHSLVEDEAGRPDLLSYRLYGTPRLWWFLLATNDIVDPLDMKRGDVIQVVDAADFYDFMKGAT